MKRIKNKVDFFVGIAIVAFFAVVWVQTLSGMGENERLFPRIVCIVGAAMGAGITIKSFFGVPKPSKEKTGIKAKLPLIIVFSFSALVLLLINVLGMYVSLFLCILCVSGTLTYLEYGMNKKQFLIAFIYDLVIIVAVFVVFNLLLQVRTPHGVLI